jgi:glyceraldehyde 3-phosphate dehydrogenase
MSNSDNHSKPKIKVGINGFGRIGRLVARFCLEPESPLQLVHVNDIHGDASTAAYLLQFDSVHGRFRGYECKAVDKTGAVRSFDVVSHGAAARIGFTSHPKPDEVPWKEQGIDLVLECTGAFKTKAALSPYFEVGVKKVVVSAPIKDNGVPNIVVGVNDDCYDTKRDNIVTAASCTTNCIAPFVKVLHENIGIKHGSFTTLHDLTNTQTPLDTAWPGKKEIRRTRSCLTNLVPTTTGSAKAITQIFPELKGLLDGVAVRLPLANASLTDCVFEMKRETSVEEVNAMLKKAAENNDSSNKLYGILGYEDRPLVSSDFTNDMRSGIVDAMSTRVINNTQIKLYIWYDNEFGYSRRMYELAVRVGQEM